MTSQVGYVQPGRWVAERAGSGTVETSVLAWMHVTTATRLYFLESRRQLWVVVRTFALQHMS